MSAAQWSCPPELGHDPILTLPIFAIQPSPHNDKLYRPVSRDDPAIIALSESIRRQGVLEPLVISADNFIISGHRRYAACCLAEVPLIPCRRRDDVHSSDPLFLTLLRDCNRQRVKSLDEIFREEVVSANPDEAYKALLKHRQEAAQLRCPSIAMRVEGHQHRAEISKAKHPFLDAVNAVLGKYRFCWPLSVRQLHYYLLNDPPLKHASKPNSTYRNDEQSYKSLIDLVARARVFGLIEWEALDDTTRPFVQWKVHPEPTGFIRQEIDQFLRGYHRDVQQSQPAHIEIVGEKNTIASIIHPVAKEYCIPYTICRGYSSLPPRQKMVERFRESGKDALVVLLLSDFDPEGEDIGHSFARSMRDDFDVEGVKVVKSALTKAQVLTLRLPPRMEAKKKSSRRGKFVKRHGEHVFELEAVEPERLQEYLREAIESVMDVDLYNAEIEKEKQDAVDLDVIRQELRVLHDKKESST
jgi:hypothetical protein